jgi:hypothetical protein
MGREEVMFSADACIALPPVTCDPGEDHIYQYDITLIDVGQPAPRALAQFARCSLAGGQGEASHLAVLATSAT